VSSVFQSVLNGSGTQKAYCSMGAGVLPGGKVAGAWCWPLQPIAEVKNEWCYTSAPPYAFVTRVGTSLPLPYPLSAITSIMHERDQLLMKLRKHIADVFLLSVTWREETVQT